MQRQELAAWSCSNAFPHTGYLHRVLKKSLYALEATVQQCQPRFRAGTDCGILPAPDNGDVEFTGTTVDSRAVYSCLEGFTLEGARLRTCLESGKWSEEEPVCTGN